MLSAPEEYPPLFHKRTKAARPAKPKSPAAATWRALASLPASVEDPEGVDSALAESVGLSEPLVVAVSSESPVDEALSSD